MQLYKLYEILLKSWFNPHIKLINLFRGTELTYSIERDIE